MIVFVNQRSLGHLFALLAAVALRGVERDVLRHSQSLGALVNHEAFLASRGHPSVRANGLRACWRLLAKYLGVCRLEQLVLRR